MVARSVTWTLDEAETREVDVRVHITDTKASHYFSIVGFVDKAVAERPERIGSAFRGF